MPDFIDHLQENDAHAKQVEANIAAARLAAARPLRVHKFCLNCNDPTQAGGAFCSTECQEDHQKIQRMRGLR